MAGRKLGKPCSTCGKPRDMEVYTRKYQNAYCRACAAARMREWRKKTPMTDEQRRKGIARAYAGVYLRCGKIQRQPCKACGCEKAEMHHHDYEKPLEIEWLCRGCHMQEHYGTPPTVTRVNMSKNHAA